MAFGICLVGADMGAESGDRRGLSHHCLWGGGHLIFIEDHNESLEKESSNGSN